MAYQLLLPTGKPVLLFNTCNLLLPNTNMDERLRQRLLPAIIAQRV